MHLRIFILLENIIKIYFDRQFTYMAFLQYTFFLTKHFYNGSQNKRMYNDFKNLLKNRQYFVPTAIS